MFGVGVDVAARVEVVLIVASGSNIGVGAWWPPQCAIDTIGAIACDSPVPVAPFWCRDVVGGWSVDVWVAGGCAGVDERAMLGVLVCGPPQSGDRDAEVVAVEGGGDVFDDVALFVGEGVGEVVKGASRRCHVAGLDQC